MENASKALLIAASVLIVVLLIAFGVGIFKSAEGAGDASDATTAIDSALDGATTELKGALGQE